MLRTPPLCGVVGIGLNDGIPAHQVLCRRSCLIQVTTIGISSDHCIPCCSILFGHSIKELSCSKGKPILSKPVAIIVHETTFLCGIFSDNSRLVHFIRTQTTRTKIQAYEFLATQSSRTFPQTMHKCVLGCPFFT
jgi:hypothetical protein